MTDVPSFDALLHATATAPEGYALYDKKQARAYIKQRNEFITFVQRTMNRSDLTADMKILTIKMHPGMLIK